MNTSVSALRAHALHLEALTKNVRLGARSGWSGWTYDDEIRLMRDAADEIQALRKAGRSLLAAGEDSNRRADAVRQMRDALGIKDLV